MACLSMSSPEYWLGEHGYSLYLFAIACVFDSISAIYLQFGDGAFTAFYLFDDWKHTFRRHQQYHLPTSAVAREAAAEAATAFSLLKF